MAKMEKLVHKGSKACQVQWDLLGIRDQQENQAKKEILEFLVPQVPEEILGRTG